MRDNKIEGIASKTEKPPQPAEEIIDEKAGDGAGKEKSGGSKPKPKAADKAAH